MSLNRLTVAVGSDLVIEIPVMDIEDGTTLSSARLLVKEAIGDIDDDALITVDVSGSECNNDESQAAAYPRFLLPSVDTAELTVDTVYWWGVRFGMSDGKEFDLPGARGTLRAITAGVGSLS